MPGFVDVSGMSYNDVKRMGREDDDVDFGSVPPRRNTVLQTGHSVSDAWAAACAAQRINGAYYKDVAYEWDEVARVQRVVKRRNRDIMMEFLQNPDRILVEDVEAGEAARNFLEQDITFRALKGQLTDFDNSVRRVLAVKDRFYTVSNNYELAVLAALPASVQRSQQRQEVSQRLRTATGGLIGQLGSKVSAQVEVLSCTYSQQYNIFWTKGITDQNQPVMFSSKTGFDTGTWLTIQGRVKAHRDNMTQLNYVKVL